MVPVGLEILFVKGRDTAATQIFWFPIKLWITLSKNQKYLSPNMVQVGLDFSISKGTATAAMQILWFPIKFGLRLLNNEQMLAQKWYQ